MAIEDVFNADPVNEDISADLLIGEGKKYKNADELAKAYANADTHIMELRRDAATLRAELELERANKANRPNDIQDPTNPRGDPLDPGVVDPAPQVVQDDFRKTVREELESFNEERQALNNAEAAAQKLVEVYGDVAKANEAVRRRAQELGVSPEWLRDAAQRSPQAFFASMGINEQGSRSTPAPHNEMVVNRQNLKGEKKYSDFEELRRTNKAQYFSMETQREMQTQAKKLGSAFYN